MLGRCVCMLCLSPPAQVFNLPLTISIISAIFPLTFLVERKANTTTPKKPRSSGENTL